METTTQPEDKNVCIPDTRWNRYQYLKLCFRGTPRPEVFPIWGAGKSYSKDLASTTIDANYFKGIDNHGQRTAIGTGKIEVRGLLSDEVWSKRHESIRRVYGSEGLSPTIPTGTGGGVMPKIEVDKFKIRRLTPVECERLQAFPDNWTAEGTGGVISDTQRYKMCGNAVTTNVIQAVFERIFSGV